MNTTTTLVRRRAARLASTATILAAALVLAGCTGSDEDAEVASAGSAPPSPTTTAETDAETEDGEEDLLAFASCMRENGIGLPDPTGTDEDALFEAYSEVMDDYTTEELETAMGACRDLMPAQTGDEREQIDPETELQLAECLRDQGVEVGDDLFTGSMPEGVDRDALIEAMDVCREVLE